MFKPGAGSAEMQATGRRLPSPEAVRLGALRSDAMRLEAMRLEADRDYMKAKHSFDNAHDTLRFTALLSPGAAFVICTLPISSH
jgi:hypothetical protein